MSHLWMKACRCLLPALLLGGCDLQVQAGGPDPGDADAGVEGGSDAGSDGGGAAAVGAISAGKHHTCGISADGGTWCWGRNQYGEQGTSGPSSSVPVPARIDGLVEISAGLQSTCGRKGDGTVWCFGRILGENQSTLKSPPAEVSAVSNSARQMATWGSGLVFRKDDGVIWAWSGGAATQALAALTTGPARDFAVGDALCWTRADGSETFCELGSEYTGIRGNGTLDGGAGPVLVPAPVLRLAVGEGFACAVLTGGDVWCWGQNDVGQTGTETSQANCTRGAGDIPCNPTPVKVQGLPGAAKALAAGYGFALALLEDGTVWGWGINDYFQLGGPIARTCTNVFGTYPCSPSPVKVPVEPLQQISASSDHICGCGVDGKAWCWGDSGSGVLGASQLPNPAGRGQPPVNPDGFRCW
jgi:alpha-tubulin suppressor-like RCC1 family protein